MIQKNKNNKLNENNDLIKIYFKFATFFTLII